MSSYLARDFDTIVNELLKRIEIKYGDVYNDFVASQQGMMLVDLIAIVGESIGFYLDRRALESYLLTARERANVDRLCRSIGYQMRAAVSGSGTLSVALVNPSAVEIPLPAGFQFKNSAGFIVEAISETIFDADSIAAKSISVREGYSQTHTTTGTGSADQEAGIVIPIGKFLLNESVTVTVDGEEWTEVLNLNFTESNQYEVWYHQNPPAIRFGNGQSGAIPPTGVEIRVTYTVTSGRIGNIGGVTQAVSSLSYGDQAVALTISQTERCSGGDDPETVDEARTKAPGFSAARDMCITNSDYLAIAGAYSSPEYGAVAKAQAYVARTVKGDLRSDYLISVSENAMDALVTTMDTAATGISTEMDTIAEASDDAASARASASSTASAIDSKIGALREQVHRIRGRHTGLSTFQASLDAALEATPSAGSPFTATILQIIESMNASSDAGMTTQAGHLEDIYDALVSGTATLTSSITEIGSTTDGMLSNLNMMENSATELDTHLATIAAQIIIIETAATAADVLADGLSSATETNQELLTEAFTSLREHLEAVLDDDGYCNLITVPILALDADGYYTAPSTGLMRNLQTYLQERSAVAHTVQVVSGHSAIVYVTIEIECRILAGYIFSSVQGQIDQALRLLLKRRAFGDDLYLSQIHDAVRSVPGADVWNITMTTDATLDASGNLIIGEEQVVAPETCIITQMT